MRLRYRLMEVFCALAAQRKYIVVFPDMTVKLYRSLREVADDTSISPATLSRGLKVMDGAMFKAPLTEYVFWIAKWKGPTVDCS